MAGPSPHIILLVTSNVVLDDNQIPPSRPHRQANTCTVDDMELLDMGSRPMNTPKNDEERIFLLLQHFT
ncbi:hypothetical protein PVK06_005405 [Gossypium arboreum]|uniref:Uncharacterized protein n=1 Tax=Gossypium arboreum TaxID=29729 RepID=A0ABR0QUI0_GOSAR|nr:hypothetical protein PVK06_005405 [Gossypium arboreum]